MTLGYPSNLVSPKNPRQPSIILFKHNVKFLSLDLNAAEDSNLSNRKYEIGEAIYPLSVTRIPSNTECPE